MKKHNLTKILLSAIIALISSSSFATDPTFHWNKYYKDDDTYFKVMVDTASNFCYLGTVEINNVSQQTSPKCDLLRTGGVWVLEITANSSARVHCRAYCYSRD